MNLMSHRFSGSHAYFFVNGIWAILRNIVVIIPGFFVGPVLARVFTDPSDIGIYDLVLTLSSFFALGAIPGLQQLVTQSSAKNHDGAFGEAVRAGMIGMFLTTPLVIATALIYKMYGQQSVSLGLFFVFPLLILTAPLRNYDFFLQGKEKFGLIAAFAGVSAVVSSGAVITAAFLTSSIIWVLFSAGIANLFTTMFFAFYTRRFIQNQKTDQGQIKYGIFLTANSFIPMLAARVDKILLASFFSPVQLGLYYFATALPAQSQRFTQSLVDVTFPKIATLSSKEHQNILKRYGLFLIVCSGIFSAVLILLMPIAIPLLFTERYRDIIFFAQLEAGSFVLFPVNLFLANMLTAQRRMKSQLMLSIIPSSVKIGAAVVAVPSFGILGVILVNFLSRFIGFIILLVALHSKRER